ncbi:MAG: CBS domain-containing protein [Gammaproteobacteria bacterium]|nr:CBS domain-containing protein [Gammaproteobacteria bacterium]
MLHSISVKEYMSASVVTFSPDDDVLDAIHTLVERRISGSPVVDGAGNIVGMLSEKDCLKVALEAGYNEGMGGKVGDYMTANVETIDADSSIMEVAKAFIDQPYKRFPVVDEEERLVGQISRADVLRAIEKIRV